MSELLAAQRSYQPAGSFRGLDRFHSRFSSHHLLRINCNLFCGILRCLKLSFTRLGLYSQHALQERGRRWVRSGEAFTSKYIYKRRSGMQVGWCEDFSLQAKTPEPPPLVFVTHIHTHTLCTYNFHSHMYHRCTFTSQKWTQADRPIEGGRRGRMGRRLRLILASHSGESWKEAESYSQPIRGPHLMFSANQNTPIAAKHTLN